MITIAELTEFIAGLPDKCAGVAVDDGGLTLVGLTAEGKIIPDCWLECGGVPTAEPCCDDVRCGLAANHRGPCAPDSVDDTAKPCKTCGGSGICHRVICANCSALRTVKKQIPGMTEYNHCEKCRGIDVISDKVPCPDCSATHPSATGSEPRG